MSNIFFYLMLVACALVVASLVMGILVMAKGGEVDKKYSNKLMQARVMFQGLALLLFMLAVMTRR
jgi:hypothetical protein